MNVLQRFGLLSFIAFACFVLFFSRVDASASFDQGIISGTSLFPFGSRIVSSPCETGLSGSYNRVLTKIGIASGTAPMVVEFSVLEFANPNCTGATGSTGDQKSIQVNPTLITWNLFSGSNFVFNPSKGYKFSFTGSVHLDDYPLLYGLGYQTSTANSYDFYRIFLDNSDAGTITVVSPSEGATVADLTNVIVSYFVPVIATSGQRTVGFNACENATSTVNNCSTAVVSGVVVVDANATGTFNLFIPFSGSFNSNTSTLRHWLIQAFVLDVNSGVVAESPLVSFDATGQFVNPAGTEFDRDLSCSFTGVFGSATFTDIICYIKQAIVWLFVPSQTITSYLQNSFDAFDNVFPFSVIYAVRDGAMFAASSTANLGNPSLSMPLPWGNTEISILSSSTMSRVVGNSGKTLVFNIFTALIWVGTALSMYMLI